MRVGVFVGWGVIVGDDVTLAVGVNVPVGVIVGPKSCPGPQPETRVLNKTTQAMIAFMLFIFLLLYQCVPGPCQGEGLLFVQLYPATREIIILEVQVFNLFGFFDPP